MKKHIKSLSVAVLISESPILIFITRNLSEIEFQDIIRSLLINFLITATIYFILTAVIKNNVKSVFLSSFGVFSFLTFGYPLAYIKNIYVFNVEIDKSIYLAIIWLTFYIVFGIILIKNIINENQVFQTLTFFAIVLSVFPTYTILTYITTNTVPTTFPGRTGSNSSDDLNFQPDIYYIILDAYGREDYLELLLSFDNSIFINELQTKGFFVGQCSRSNYNQTQLSISSSLNFSYIDSLYDIATAKNEQELTKQLQEFIFHNNASAFLEQYGYSFFTFQTSFPFSNINDSDKYYQPPNQSILFGEINKFEAFLLSLTGLSFFNSPATPFSDLFSSIFIQQNTAHKKLTEFQFETLGMLPNIEGPKFVFAHIVSPHEPFIFDKNGDLPDPYPEYIEGHTDNISYINQRVLNIIDILIDESSAPPIIVIQGDHGAVESITNKDGRFAILNAYFLPNSDQQLPDIISPVNTFRIIFNTYFNQNFELLDDVSYYYPYQEPYQAPSEFTVIPKETDICSP